MDNYDDKSLLEIFDIAKTKYNIDYPDDIQIGDAIELLRQQDENLQNQLQSAIKNNINVFPSNLQTSNIVLNNDIKFLPGLQSIKLKDGPPLNNILETSSNVESVESSQKQITLPSSVRHYFLNDNNTLTFLNGNPYLPWDTNFQILNAVVNNNGSSDANVPNSYFNPKASFQSKILHPHVKTSIPYSPLSSSRQSSLLSVVPTQSNNFNNTTSHSLPLFINTSTTSISNQINVQESVQQLPVSQNIISSQDNDVNSPTPQPSLASPLPISIKTSITQPSTTLTKKSLVDDETKLDQPPIINNIVIPSVIPTPTKPLIIPTPTKPSVSPNTIKSIISRPSTSTPKTVIPGIQSNAIHTTTTQKPSITANGPNPSITPRVITPSIIPRVISPSINANVIKSSVTANGPNPSITPRVISPSINANVIKPSITPNAIKPSLTANGPNPSITPRVISPSINPRVISTSITSSAISPSITANVIKPSITANVIKPSITPSAISPSITANMIKPMSQLSFPNNQIKSSISINNGLGIQTVSRQKTNRQSVASENPSSLTINNGLLTGNSQFQIKLNGANNTSQQNISGGYNTKEVGPSIASLSGLTGQFYSQFHHQASEYNDKNNSTILYPSVSGINNSSTTTNVYNQSENVLIEGQTVNGLRTITRTRLQATIPNLLGKQRPESQVSTMNKYQEGVNNVQQINLPKFTTTIDPVTTNFQNNETTVVVHQIDKSIINNNNSIMAVLNEIDPSLLTSERTGKNKKGYGLDELKSFAQRLGLTVSGKKKQVLIDEIQKLRIDRGIV